MTGSLLQSLAKSFFACHVVSVIGFIFSDKRQTLRTQFSYYPQVDEPSSDEHSRWSIQTSTPVVPRRKKGSFEESCGGDASERNMCDTTSTGLEESTITLGPDDGSRDLYSSSMYDDSRAGSFVAGAAASLEDVGVEAASTGGGDWLSRYGHLFGPFRADKGPKAPLATPM